MCVALGSQKHHQLQVTVPMIRQYIDPLLADTENPKTLYVVGHSLGAGIATLAGCYFVLEPDYQTYWTNSTHQLRVVTAGGPRACGTSMVSAVDAKLEADNHKSIHWIRCVRDKDGVSNVPPAMIGFGHISHSLVFVTKEDRATGRAHVLLDPNRTLVAPKHVMEKLAEEHDDLEVVEDDDDDDEDDANGDQARSSTALPKALPHEELTEQYEKKINMIPRSLRDHMPEFYLRPLYRLVEAEKGE